MARGSQSIRASWPHDPRHVGLRAAGRRDPPGARDVERIGPDAAHSLRCAASSDRASALRGQRCLSRTLRAPGPSVARASASCLSRVNIPEPRIPRWNGMPHTRPMHPESFLGSFAWLAALAFVSTTACSKGNAGGAAPPNAAPMVTISRAASRDVPTYLNEIGRSGAFESVTVMPQLAGRILERHFQDGAQLKMGQLLFTIDPRPYQAQLDATQAQLAQSRAALNLALTQLKMYESITDVRAVSALDLETKKNSVAVDQAQVQAAEAAVENAKLNLEYCYIHSPIEGRAGARLVDVGNVVQANTTPLLLVQRLDPIYADFTITEGDLPNVQAEMNRGTLQTLVRLPSDPEEHARGGKLTFLDNTVQN